MSTNYYYIIIIIIKILYYIIIIGLCQYSISTHKKRFTFCFAFAKAEKNNRDELFFETKEI